MTTSNPFHNFGLEGILVPGANKGKIVYVDTAANGALDANSGLRIGEAKLTISGALDVCTDNMWDTIVVLNHTAATEIAWPISIDVRGVRIVGAPGGGYMPRYSGSQIIMIPSGDTACFSIAADHLHIANLEFRAGVSHAGIEFDAASEGERSGIYNCVFSAGLYGVWATGSGMPSQGPTIKNCLFIASLTSDGILYHSNGPFARFEENVFDEVAGIAINVTGAAAAGFILNNTISLPSDTAALGIVISGSQAQRWIVNGNHANFGTSDMSANPYLDTADQDNHWLRNYRGMTPVHPSAE